MLQAYPVVFRRDTNGTVIAEVPDVPGTMTVGNDRHEALERVQDALIVMLSGLMDRRAPIPRPSRPKKGQPTVALPPMAAAKLSIYRAMLERNVTQLELASRLGCDARQVRRLLDLDHNSRLDHLDAALHALGKRFVLDVRDAA